MNLCLEPGSDPCPAGDTLASAQRNSPRRNQCGGETVLIGRKKEGPKAPKPHVDNYLGALAGFFWSEKNTLSPCQQKKPSRSQFFFCLVLLRGR